MPDSARDIVFISYRRSDARHPAGRIHEKLEDAVEDRAEVYMDVDSIAPGKNFRTHLEQAIVVIGSTWLTASKGDSVWWRTLLPWLVSLLKPVLFIAAILATLWLVAVGGMVVAMLLNFPFLALAGKWRIPNCDAALALVRSKLGAPPAAAKA